MSVHLGTHGRYSSGCRCDPCRAAHADYTRERRAEALAAGSLSHGRSSTYDAGCRCEKCYSARQVKYHTAPSEYPKSHPGTRHRAPKPYTADTT